MTTTRTRQPVAARRTGFAISALVNAVLLVLIDFWPGWSALPFLTGGMNQVLLMVNVVVLAGLVTNLVYLVNDAPRLVALGGVLTTALGLAGLIRIWQVFPFDFADSSVDWALIVRVLLILGIIGSPIGIIANLVALARGCPRNPGRNNDQR